MSTKISNAVQEVRNEFLREHADLLALTRNGADDVMRRIAAALALDNQSKEEVQFYIDAVDQKGYAGEVALADFKRELMKATARAFLECQRNGVIEFVTRVTDEAQLQQEDIEIEAGVRAPRPVVPPPPPPKSAQEILIEQIKDDWLYLPTAKIRQKCNDRQYKAEFDKLMAADELKSQVTRYTDGAAEFRL